MMKITLSVIALYVTIIASTISPALALGATSNKNTAIDAVIPFVECVDTLGPNSFVAHFGYLNTTGTVVNIPAGPNNYFRSGPANLGQTTSFQPGRVVDAFQVPFTRFLSWVINSPSGFSSTATATSAYPACSGPTPTPTPVPTPTPNPTTPLVLNEIEIDPPSTKTDACSYVEVRGLVQDGVVAANTYFLSVNSDSGNFGFATQAVNFGGQQIGANRTITLVNTLSNCPNRTFDTTTRVVNYTSPAAIGQGSETYLIVQATAPLFSGQDLDTNNDGVFDANFGITVIDGFALLVNPEEEFVYGASSGVVNISNTTSLDQPDAVTRYLNDDRPFEPGAFFYGELAATPDEAVQYVAPFSPTVPSACPVLTPGLPNVQPTSCPLPTPTPTPVPPTPTPTPVPPTPTPTPVPPTPTPTPVPPTPTPTPTPVPPTPTPTPVPPTPTPTPTPAPAAVIINEVDADTTGTDVLEFVELYDGGVGNTSLTGLVLVFYNGSNDQSYFAIDLDGLSTNANGYFTIGNAGVAGVDLVFPDNTLQNGQDAVALYAANATDFPVGTAVTTANLRDALVYDTADADDPGLLVLLNAAQPQIDEDGTASAATVSMQRCPNGSGGPRNTSTYAIFAPTPDGSNTCAAPTAGALLLNEVEIDPPSTISDACQFAEIKGQNAGGVVPANTYFLSVNSDGGNFGFANQAINIGGQVVGANGTITLLNNLSGGCPNRVFPAGTTQVNFTSPLFIGQGSETYLIVTSTTALSSGQDLDTNDDGLFDAGFGITVLDGFALIVNPEEEYVYGAAAGVVNISNTTTLDQPDAVTRFPSNTTAFVAAAFYFGELAPSPDETTAFAAPFSPNFPAGGALTPGAPNLP